MPLLAQTWPFPWPEDRIARYTARRASSPIVVDGRLDEADWQAAERSPRFADLIGGRPGIHDTRAAVLWDDTNLYVGYWVEEPFVEATLTERDAQIYTDNDVELFIAGRDAYYEFEINAFGTIYEVFFIWEREFESSGYARRPEFDRSRPGVRPFNGVGFKQASARPAHRLLELGPARPGDGGPRGRDDQRQQRPRPRLDGGAAHPVAFAGASGDAGWARVTAAGRRRVAHGLLAVQPVQGGPASEGSRRLGVEPARRVGFARPGAVHPRALLHRARQPQVEPQGGEHYATCGRATAAGARDRQPAGGAMLPRRPDRRRGTHDMYVFGDSYSDIGAGYIDGNGPTAVAYLGWLMGLQVASSKSGQRRLARAWCSP